jgi:hypothetical protein
MARHRDLPLATPPNIVAAASPDEIPAEGPKALLKLTALHGINIHIYV